MIEFVGTHPFMHRIMGYHRNYAFLYITQFLGQRFRIHGVPMDNLAYILIVLGYKLGQITSRGNSTFPIWRYGAFKHVLALS